MKNLFQILAKYTKEKHGEVIITDPTELRKALIAWGEYVGKEMYATALLDRENDNATSPRSVWEKNEHKFINQP